MLKDNARGLWFTVRSLFEFVFNEDQDANTGRATILVDSVNMSVQTIDGDIATTSVNIKLIVLSQVISLSCLWMLETKLKNLQL